MKNRAVLLGGHVTGAGIAILWAAGVDFPVAVPPASSSCWLVPAWSKRRRLAWGQTVQLIGMPEAQLTLAHATVHLATAPKSNAVTMALAAAMGDIKAGRAGLVPPHLRDGHYSGAAALGNAQGYSYPHDDPDGIVAQQYPPDELVGSDYYRPTTHGAERDIAGRLDRLRAILRRGRLVAVDSLERLRAVAVQRLEVVFAGAAPDEQELRALPGVREVHADGPHLLIAFEGSADPVVKALAAHEVRSIRSRDDDLEEIFLHYYRDQPA